MDDDRPEVRCGSVLPVSIAGAIEALAESMCDRFAGTMHNMSLGWADTSEGSRDWWRDQASLLLTTGPFAEVWSQQLQARTMEQYRRADAERNEIRANQRMVQMRQALVARARDAESS